MIILNWLFDRKYKFSIDKIVMIVRGHVSEETYAKEYKLWGTKVIGTWVETNSDMDFKANFGLHDLYLLYVCNPI